MRAMSPTSSARAVTSMGTSSSSLRARLNRSCRMMIPLASVHRRLQKVIVHSSNSRLDQQGGQIQKRFSAQKRMFSSLHIRSGWREHPYRNLQPLACRVEDRHCAVATFGSTNNPQTIAVKRMIGIENLNMRGICTQGIVRDDGIILTSIVWSPPADSPSTTLCPRCQQGTLHIVARHTAALTTGTAPVLGYQINSS